MLTCNIDLPRQLYEFFTWSNKLSFQINSFFWLTLPIVLPHKFAFQVLSSEFTIVGMLIGKFFNIGNSHSIRNFNINQQRITYIKFIILETGNPLPLRYFSNHFIVPHRKEYSFCKIIFLNQILFYIIMNN